MTMTMTMTMTLFLILAALQAGDVYTTWRVLGHGGREVNPVMAFAIQNLGMLPALIIVKIATLAVVWFFARIDWFLLLACVGYVAVLINNINEMRKGNHAG